MRRAVPGGRIDGLLAGEGLKAAQVAERRARYGGNDILEAPRRQWADLARETARDPMLWFLAATSAVYAAIGERIEAATLAAAVLPLVGMDAFLHRRTQASTAGLRSRLAATAVAVRDGRETAVPAEALVPGDLVVVGAGEPFPADGIVVGGEALQADESSLTGEAYPVAKAPARAPAGDTLVDGAHWGLAGTRLLTGRALVRVVCTGDETLYGEIVRSAAGGARARTPLQAAVGRLVRTLVWVAAALCVLLALVRYGQGHGALDALLSAITLGVAALPEELPVAFAFFLGVGVFRLARRQALVRRAVSVENIGRVTCICSDKTGTITEGRLRVSRWEPARGWTEPRLMAVAAAAARRESGDPLDAAILDAAGPHAAGGEVEATFPFTEDRRRETAILREPDGTVVAATKGSPEVILSLTSLDDDARAEWGRRVESLAAGGRKVIAGARRPMPEGDGKGGEPVAGFEMAGLVACEDPVREGAADAVRRCREAGIHVILVTGDHPATALDVARTIGLGGAQARVVLGDDLEARLAGGRLRPRDVDVIARALPAQKLHLVRALQSSGETVAVTGDGVNDVPALQAADVGIAMGGRGTRSAREVASIVLLDDDFGSIVAAIAEGRQLFRNLQLCFHYLLTIHMGLVLPATLLPLLGFPLLYLPIHIVWLELIVHPTAMLVFQELPSRGVLGPAAGGRDVRFFDSARWRIIWTTGLLLTVAIVLAYTHGVNAGGPARGRAMAIASLALGSSALAATLSGLRTRLAGVVAAATALASAVLIQVPALAERLHLQPLRAFDWLVALAAAAGAVVLPDLAARLRPPSR